MGLLAVLVLLEAPLPAAPVLSSSVVKNWPLDSSCARNLAGKRSFELSRHRMDYSSSILGRASLYSSMLAHSCGRISSHLSPANDTLRKSSSGHSAEPSTHGYIAQHPLGTMS